MDYKSELHGLRAKGTRLLNRDLGQPMQNAQRKPQERVFEMEYFFPVSSLGWSVEKINLTFLYSISSLNFVLHLSMHRVLISMQLVKPTLLHDLH